MADVQEQLSRLDGCRADNFWIEIDGVGALSIGGGPDRFIVVSLPPDGSSAHVEMESQRQETVRLQVGGQTGTYAAAMVLPVEAASCIAERFILRGEYDDSFTWVQDCPPEQEEQLPTSR